MDTLEIALPKVANDSRTSTTIVSAISSDGKIRIYDLAAVPIQTLAELPELIPIAEYDTKGSRLTCMALGDGEVVSLPSSNKRRHEDIEDDLEDDMVSDDDSSNDAEEDEKEIEEEAEEEEDEDED